MLRMLVALKLGKVLVCFDPVYDKYSESNSQKYLFVEGRKCVVFGDRCDKYSLFFLLFFLSMAYVMFLCSLFGVKNGSVANR